MKKLVAIPVAACVLLAVGWLLARQTGAAAPAPPPQVYQWPTGRVALTAVGHEFRQDDLPSLAAAPDGSLWVAWLSFAGDRDDIAIRRFHDGKWGNLQWVPGTSGDSWLPQVGVDAQNRVWVVWSQQASGNWDIYARRLDPASQQWGTLERLTSDPLPDINPRAASNRQGRVAVTWQGFRGKNSNIFLRTLDGEKWSPEVRVTSHAANDWDPAVALDSRGNPWVAYDSYRNGNYDVYLWNQGKEIAVAATPRFEARATLAIDNANRVWVAWESGHPNWGKDQGFVIRSRQTGAALGGFREPRLRCYENGRWQEPTKPLASLAPGGNVYQPHVFADHQGSIWVIAQTRESILTATQQPEIPNRYNPPPQRGYWEYWITRLEGDRWAEPLPLPRSKGRSSTRGGAAVAGDGQLWVAWATDNRVEGFYHRPLRQQVYTGAVRLAAAGAPPALKAAAEEPVQAQPGHPDEPGDLRAIRSYAADVRGKKLRIVRGDFHRHTEFSWDRGGEPDGSLLDFYRYMIDAGGMDFGASTDHQGGAWPYWWWLSQKLTDMYHVPAAYVPIFGYERSAVFPNGHRNVFFARRNESRITPFFLKEGAQGFSLPLTPQGDEPGTGTGELVGNDTKLLYEDIRARNGIAISHTSGTNMGTDWRDNDPDLEPVVEIFQGCRTSYEQLGAPLVVDEPSGRDVEQVKLAGYRPEGMVSDAWAKGYKLGIITSSDHFSTHISYAMVYTEDPSRQGILDAIRRRHTYGATDNIILDVRMGEHFMGDEFALQKPQPLRVKARGTRPIARVDVIKDNRVIYSTTPRQQNVEFEYTDTGSVAGRHFYYVRLQQEDEMIAWSSPMFINYR